MRVRERGRREEGGQERHRQSRVERGNLVPSTLGWRSETCNCKLFLSACVELFVQPGPGCGNGILLLIHLKTSLEYLRRNTLAHTERPYWEVNTCTGGSAGGRGAHPLKALSSSVIMSSVISSADTWQSGGHYLDNWAGNLIQKHTCSHALVQGGIHMFGVAVK